MRELRVQTYECVKQIAVHGMSIKMIAYRANVGIPPSKPTIAIPHSGRLRFGLLDALDDAPNPPPGINVHHEFGVGPRHDLDILVDSEGVIELARWFGLSMLDIPYFAVHPDLHTSSMASCSTLAGIIVI